MSGPRKLSESRGAASGATDESLALASALPRRIGFWSASAIMVGIIIGSGIFQTPPDIAKKLGDPAIILLLWAVGGAVSLCGALCYAELATMFPHSGGIYVFLREGFGRALAFTFGWTYLLITKPFAAAGIAVILAEHFNGLLGTSADKRWLTCAVLTLLTAVNTPGVRLGGWAACVLTTIKLLALAAIVALCVLSGRGDSANFAAGPAPAAFWLALAPVMSGILWTYDGWSDVGSIAGEIRDPQRNIPRTFLAGTIVVTVLYVAVNAAYLALVPLAEMRSVGTVAPLVMERLTGPAGQTAVYLIVIISTLGSTHGAVLTGARVTFAQARDGLLFGFLGRVSPRFHTPVVALWSQLLLSCAAVWLAGGKFQKLADGFVFTMWIFYGLAGVAVFVLRRSQPDRPRPYRCWGYPLVPATFVLSALGVTVLSIVENPRQTLPWLAVLLIGLPVHAVWERVRRGRGVAAR